MEVALGKNVIEISWSEGNLEEVKSAEKKFNQYTRQGWFAYVEKPDGSKKIVYEFDPALKKIYFVHAITGG